MQPVDPNDPLPERKWEDFVKELESQLFQDFLKDKLLILGVDPSSDEWEDLTEPYEDAFDSGDAEIHDEFYQWFTSTGRERRMWQAARKQRTYASLTYVT